jgi:hypothetical protein
MERSSARAARVHRWLTISRVIDLHCHILPGIDDGPPDEAGSVALGRALVAARSSLQPRTFVRIFPPCGRTSSRRAARP